MLENVCLVCLVVGLLLTGLGLGVLLRGYGAAQIAIATIATIGSGRRR